MSRAIQLVALILVLALSGITSQWLIADIYGERVALSIDDWRRSRITPSEAILNKHLEFIEQARDWSPANARYMELEARLRLLRLPHLLGSEDFDAELQNLQRLHRLATELRPHWPFSWANLAYAKNMGGEFDDEFNTALINTLNYGPYEQAAIDRIIYAGLSAWQRDQLSDDARQAFLESLANGAELHRGYARYLRNQLQRKGSPEQLCPLIPFHSELGRERLCG